MASKRRIRRNACTGKLRHTSQDNAGLEIKAMRRRGYDTSKMRPYKCKFCNGFHVGHWNGKTHGV